ncbi:hypothetical protein Drose_15510 [Dactylosporangium roseum]|uniref:Uncharacterized protein n=1 Tax=Dactylosporangium roseum TaxID=47989 RepID=A0ABY5ZD58_9ACTN|nr:hypothetical protein [Dactylosporangium roseum]UWZ39511.1 hypothetical protein Drose_15510 [Dactylosporangium roseum]
MAPGVGRLGSFLSAEILDVLRVLDATPAPRGHELAAATALRDWCAARWPDIAWTVRRYSPEGANLVAACGTGPLLYSHLDTSLNGAESDAAITGRADGAGPLHVRDGRVEGFGLGVARAPAAAALVGFVAARRGSLLLAGSGTHRRGGGSAGVLAYLADHPRPPAAIVAKCGPGTVLWEEPGALYLRVQVTGGYGAALAPDSAVPSGGIAAQAGQILAAVGAWRERYLATRRPVGQIGPQAGVGAIRSGSAAKPDLLPADVQLDLYVVTMPGEDPVGLAEEVEAHLRVALAGTALGDCVVGVTAEPLHPAAGTPRDAPIVTAARRLWEAEFGGAPPPIAGWTGSTDGVVLRAHGIDTVRLGPQSGRSPADSRRETLAVDQLVAFSRIYAALLSERSPTL